MRNAAIKKLFSLAQNDRNIILMTGDLGFGVLDQFSRELPDQFINAGICEQNMTSVAAGMALSGKIVFTYSIGNFPTLRCLEQVRNDVAYHNANVKIFAVGCGMAYGSLGMSHHATEDIAIMRALPNITVFTPGDLTEAECVVEAAYKLQGPCYIRLGKGREPRIHEKINNFQVGKALKIFDGKKVCVFSAGGILDQSFNACKSLKEEDIDTALYSFPTVKPMDADTVKECAEKFDYIVTVEEHNKSGGFGGAVAEILAEMPGKRALLKRIAMNDVYPSIVGDQDYLRKYYGVSADDIVKAVKALI